jgi:hypothetical protein
VFAFKQHLGIGVDDLAGVARAQGQVAEARTLYREAERIFSDVVEADPENLEPEITLLHTQINQARMEQADLQFGSAATLFRRVLDRVNRLEADGRMADGEDGFLNTKSLKAEIDFCDAAPRARDDFAFARNYPAALAARLLVLHARSQSDTTKRPRRLTEVAEALVALDAEAPGALHELAQQLAQFISDLESRRWPELAQAEREKLLERCADRRLELLRQAHARGFSGTAAPDHPELAPIQPKPADRSTLARPDTADGRSSP